MTTNGKKPQQLTPRQRALIDALCAPPYPTITQACKSLGLSVNTGHKWTSRDELFALELRRRLDEQSAEARTAAQAAISRLTPKALDALEELLSANSEHTRLNAAVWLLEHTVGRQPAQAGRTLDLAELMQTPIQVEYDLDKPITVVHEYPPLSSDGYRQTWQDLTPEANQPERN